MKLLVLSDTHGYLREADELLRRLYGDIDGVFFLGDGAEDAETLGKAYKGLEFYVAAGNCDGSRAHPVEISVRLGGVLVLGCHGHTFGVKSNLRRLAERAGRQGARVCLFGHTHEAYLDERDGIIYMNPGSLALPRNASYGSYGILDMDGEGGVSAAVVSASKPPILLYSL